MKRQYSRSNGLAATLEGRFWAKVDKADGCWLWTASRGSHGYGQIGLEKTVLLAHRVSYELANGRIPQGMQIDHLCRNRICVNPDHLEVVTQQENIRRGEIGSQTHCPRDHAYAGANLYVRPNGHRECRTCIRMRKAAAA